MDFDIIRLRGMRQNNLKNISLDIPKNKIAIFTGVSGSGKSSIVFDTIGNEANRQMNQIHSAFIQNFLPKYDKPDVERIENISPVLVVDQSRLAGNIRSTVGTVTDIYSFIRVLYSRLGQPYAGPANVFSFNDPEGMCPTCSGIGQKIVPDLDKIVDMTKSLNDGAITFPVFSVDSWYWKPYQESGFYDMDLSINEYSPELREKLLYGKAEKITVQYKGRDIEVDHDGVMNKFTRLYIERDLSTQSEKTQEKVAPFMKWDNCETCHGQRLNQKSLATKIAGKNIDDIVHMELNDLLVFMQSIDAVEEVRPVVREINNRLHNLVEMNLGYLTLSRQTPTLSGGEAQRIKVVGYLNNSLNNLIYIFDEPSTGLHPRDVDNLNNMLKKLRDNGNTILVVEHDPNVIRVADHIVDVGPKAGRNGGEIMYEGDVAGLIKSETLTGIGLRQAYPFKEAPRAAQDFYEITNATANNLANVSVNIPKEVFTVVTGVAGSGKSSLIFQEFLPKHPEAIIIDQSALHKSSRSNLATYTGILDVIRAIFAKKNSVDKSLFSFNSKGACEKCKGKGYVEFNLAFMEEVKTVCSVCNGNQFKQEVLTYEVGGKNIVDILKMTVSEALVFFRDAKITKSLSTLEEVGVGYLTLGQSVKTLSGGECQRIKLASELHKTGNLYVLDEPTTGLHMTDVEHLLELLNKLVDNHCTVVVIEHNIEVMKQADWLIDIGPDAGKIGGTIVYTGIPANTSTVKESITGRYL